MFGLTTITFNVNSQMPTRLGRYAIECEIGRGGMGVVYRARDEKLGKLVAVKILLDPGSLSAENRRRLRQEARSAAILNHPAIVAVYDYDEEEGSPFVVYEFVEGQTLDKSIAAGASPENRIIDIGSQIAAGLAYAHERGILHRDIKPQNIIVGDDGRARILDFGVAKKISASLVAPDGSPIEPDAVATLAGTIVGTVQYMSPEQVAGEVLDGRTDIFSLGTVLYEMATGKNPFFGQSLTSIIGKIMSPDPPRLEVESGRISNELRQIILNALQKKREVRYQSAVLLREDLDRLKSERSTLIAAVVPTSQPKPIVTVIPRGLARSFLVLLQFLYLGIYGFALYYHGNVISRIMSAAMPHLGADFGRSFELAKTLAISFLVSGCCGIPIRLYLMVSVGFNDPETGRQFGRLFPFLFLLDEIWALTPLLLIGKWPAGITILCMALLVYLPISHRNLMRCAYP